MKFSLLCLLYLFSVSSFAAGFKMVCHNEEDRIELTNDEKSEKSTDLLSIYNQGGLGPNFLEASYEASESIKQSSPSDTLFVSAKFPFGGEISVEFGVSETQDGKGHIIYPGTNKKIKLKDCTY